MPTAAKLVAALYFGALAWFTSHLVIPLLPESTPTAFFPEGNFLIGFVSGWTVMGPRAGFGMRMAIGGGLTTVATMVFWALLIHSIMSMIKLSLLKHYKDPFEAVVGVFQIALEYGMLIVTPTIIGTLIIGGIFGGWLAELAARRWP